MPDSDMTLSDTAQHRRQRRNSGWRPPKLEMEITIEQNEFADQISTVVTDMTVPDSSVTLPTLPDVC